MNNAMGSDGRSYGAKYNGKLGTAEIAKLVRKDIAAAIKAGDLPAMKASVRIERFSGGSSISIKVSGLAMPVFNPERLRLDRDEPHAFTRLPRYTEEAQAVLKLVEAILGAYNHDGSDLMTDYFDVKFYAHVDFDHNWESARRELEMARVTEQDDAAIATHDTIPVPANDTAAPSAAESCIAAWAHEPGQGCCLCEA